VRERLSIPGWNTRLAAGMAWLGACMAIIAKAGQSAIQPVLQRLRWMLGALERGLPLSAGHRAEEAGWVAGVGRAARDLEQMNRSTEAGFLAVGEKLSSFLTAARQVSTSASATAESISGEPGQRDADALTQVLEETAAIRRSAESATDLARLRDSAQRLRHVFAGFDNTVISFHVLAVLARIETARLGESGAGLVHLVEEMRGCGDDIASRTERFLATAASLGCRVEAELDRISELDARELQALRPLTEAVARDFAALRSRRELGAAAATRLGEQFAQVTEAIGGVVTAVQFHDITRQQIEHVIESLRQLHDSAGNTRRGPPAAQEAAVLGLQVAQLENAQRTFLESIGRIDRQLESVAHRVGEMAAESERLTGQSQGQNETFFAGMAARFAGILKAARECQSCEVGARTALEDLRQALAALGAALVDIQVIEFHLKRVSLNAAVQAVHLGGAGEPFNAVAVAMHGLQSDCENRSRQSRAELDSIDAAIRGAGDNGMQSPSRERAGMETVVIELRQRMEEMHAANERGLASFQEIGALVGRLSAEIQAARQHLAESRAGAEIVDDCCARLRTVSGVASGVPLGELAQWTQNYTMRTEHEVHRELTGAGLSEAGPAAAGPAAGELELF